MKPRKSKINAYSMSKQELKKLVKGQRLLKTIGPVTTRATFQLVVLEALIKDIKRSIGSRRDRHSLIHDVCITFVRDDVDNSALGYGGSLDIDVLRQNSTRRNGVRYTQLIPIITGCRATIDPVTGRYKKFKFLRIGNKIPYARSGGEASGLIPPPPPNDDGLR